MHAAATMCMEEMYVDAGMPSLFMGLNLHAQVPLNVARCFGVPRT